MISAKEIHELRFEKAAFGYKQEDIDEFLTQLEQEVEIAEQEMADSNEKIQVLADKVREYMRDEDALKDALLGAQREGHRIIAEANAKADGIIADAKKRADAMMDEVTVKHEALLAKNQAEIDEDIRLWQMPESRLQTSRRLCLICIKNICRCCQPCQKKMIWNLALHRSRMNRKKKYRNRKSRWYPLRLLTRLPLRSSLQRPFRVLMIRTLAI